MKTIVNIKGNRGRFKILFILLIFNILVVSCNWLEVIPDNIPTIEHAFNNRAIAERYLFTCYVGLPDPTNPFGYPAYFTNRDEFEFGTNDAKKTSVAAQIAQGGQNTTAPYMSYWSGGQGGKNMFQAIRTCNLFLEGIHQPRDMMESERNRWIAEVKFLKAYYHFFLLQLYGPIPLIKENIPLSATPDEVRIFREPVDECIAYIVELIDEAVPDLPLVIADRTTELGRITQPIALGVKAKALVWGASPLFNGNPDYSGWKDSRNIQLVSDIYSREKWEKAAKAIRAAIDTCHLAGHELYIYDKASNPNTRMMSDSIVPTMTVRKAVTERWNDGVIWASCASFTPKVSLDDMQHILFPILYANDVGDGMTGYCLASFNMAELFYTNSGIPIDEDPDWNYEGRYEPRLSSIEENNGLYIPIGQQTASLNFNREARFYANLGFDRGFFELSSATSDYGASFSPYLQLRNGDVGNFFTVNNTGYQVKKLIAFETRGGVYLGYNYRFPLLRLSDLYLLYSEALNELKDTPDTEVYEWMDKVREIVGLQGVVESWTKSKYPNRPKEKDEMRKIIQQERMIELAFEGQRFWDMRRWKLADLSRTYIPKGWNPSGRTAAEYYEVIEVDQGGSFTLKDYLWPISDYDLRINTNLVQSYGW